MNICVPLPIPFLSWSIAQNVTLAQPIPNCIMPNSTFSKIGYSDNGVVLTTLFLSFEPLYFSYYDFIEAISCIEIAILNCYCQTFTSAKNKNPKIVVKCGVSKRYIGRVLKITGIWESETHYGIIYRFIESTP
jgi:hypothetical protein